MQQDTLITGGAGFLGRHLAAAMAQRGHRVTVLDDLSAPSSDFGCAPLRHPSIHCIHDTILHRERFQALVREHPLVLHLASVVGVEHTIAHPLATMRNLEGTLHLAEALTPEHTVLFTSSADVYGVHSRLYDRAMREDDLTVYEDASVNRWVYPRIKSLEENLVAHSPARSANIRVFNSYGPGMDQPQAKRVVPRFIEDVLAGRPLQLSGDGHQRRSFCYYTDTVAGMLAALDLAQRSPSGQDHTFNIGHDEPISIAALARLVLEVALELGVLSRPVEILSQAQLYSRPFDDTWHRVPDLTRARRALGYQPQVSLRQGLRMTLEQTWRQRR